MVSNMDKNTPIVVECTVSDQNEAILIGDLLVKKGLAACVQIHSDILSIYSWNNSIQHDQEILLSIKTLHHFLDSIEPLIYENTSYDTPQMTYHPFYILNQPYKDWFLACLK